MKSNLHKLIVETDDNGILDKIQAYFITLKSKNIDWWDAITENDKNSIADGIAQLKEGRGIPHDQVQKEIHKIIAKK